MTPSHKLLILSEQAQEYQRLLAAAHLPGLELVPLETTAQALERGAECDLAFGEPSLLKDVLAHLPRLNWIQATWAGVEPLLEPGLRRDYQLTNARGIFGGLMSEYVFGYLLLHERGMLACYRAQQEHRWDHAETGSLHGKRLGLLGVGSIGAHLAGTAKHFGMQVSGYTLSSEGCADVDAYFHPPRLLEFAAGLDYLVGALPCTAATRHIVDAALLARLPERAVLVNVGRGSTVDESALEAALRSGQIVGAVLDVFEQEPLPSGHPFWTTPNLIITAHVAAPTLPADMAGVFVENYRRLLAGRPLMYRVDFTRGY